MGTYTPEFLLSLLPPIMKDLDTEGDLYDFLEIFTDLLNEFEEKIGDYRTFYRPYETPDSVLDYLAQGLGVSFNKNFGDSQYRRAIASAVHWYKRKGTIPALDSLIESLGYVSNLIEYKMDPSERPYLLDINGGGPATVTGVTLDYPTGAYSADTTPPTTYILNYDFSANTLSWDTATATGLPVTITGDGVYVLIAPDGISTIRATVVAGSLPGGDASDTVDVNYDSNYPIKFTDSSSYLPAGLMDDLTDWVEISTNILTLTTTPGEFKVGTAAIKFDKNTTFAYSGMYRNFITGFILKDADVSRMRGEWWVYLPSISNVTGVTLRISNTSYGLATDYSEWTVTTDYQGFPLQTGWNKININLFSAPTNTVGSFDILNVIHSLSLVVNTSSSAITLTGVIMDGLAFVSGGIQSPLFGVEFSNPAGFPINPTIVNYLINEINVNKPVYAIMRFFTYLTILSVYLDLVASITTNRSIVMTYAPVLYTDQELPPVIVSPDIILTDIGLLTDYVPYYCEFIATKVGP